MANNESANHESLPSWELDDLIHGYWVLRGRLLATEYPGPRDPGNTARKLGVLRAAGITSFVDLNEAGEPTWGGDPMRPYDGDLHAGARYRRFPIPDTGVIDDAGYNEILARGR